VGGAEGKACGVMQVLLARGAYAPWVRSNVIQAQYFKVRRVALCELWGCPGGYELQSGACSNCMQQPA
jgi:hypothetical protein